MSGSRRFELDRLFAIDLAVFAHSLHGEGLVCRCVIKRVRAMDEVQINIVGRVVVQRRGLFVESQDVGGLDAKTLFVASAPRHPEIRIALRRSVRSPARRVVRINVRRDIAFRE